MSIFSLLAAHHKVAVALYGGFVTYGGLDGAYGVYQHCYYINEGNIVKNIIVPQHMIRDFMFMGFAIGMLNNSTFPLSWYVRQHYTSKYNFNINVKQRE